LSGKYWQRASYRIAAKAALILALASILLGGGSLLLVRYSIAHALDARIAAASSAIVANAQAGDDGAVRAAIVHAIERKESQLGIALFDAAGRRVVGNLEIPRPAPGWSDVSVYDPVEGSDPARVLAVDVPDGHRVAVAGNRRPLDTAEEAIGWLCIAAALTILIVSLSLALLLGNHLDSRLAPIARTADAVIAGELSQRVPVSRRDDEFDRVAISLNAMLDRVSELMAKLRGIASDIAHDLRTPLTRLRAKLELALATSTERDASDSVIQDAIRAIDEILSVFGSVLRIAEIEEGDAPRRHEVVDLGALGGEIAETMQPVFEEAGLKLCFLGDAASAILGDREQLAAAIINLLENALRHTGFGTIVTLRTFTSASNVIVSVEDTGAGVPETALDRIFDRFVRLDTARATPGHGLGLSLVRAVVLANGGTVRAVNAADGFMVVLRFPRHAWRK